MALDHLSPQAASYLRRLCFDVPHRRLGSAGNQAATKFFATVVTSFGFETTCPRFDCIDWTHGDVHLTAAGEPFEAFVSPYSLGCHASAPLAVASTVQELEAADLSNRVVLLRGDLVKEQLMPKNFPFYNPDEHRRIIHLLETSNPLAILAATSRDPSLAGAMYPFSLVEDGDFNIPSVYLKDTEGDRLAEQAGSDISLAFEAARIPSWGCNVVARKGAPSGRRVVFCAHIDAKETTPGALDNAAGIAVLLLLAELLQDYAGGLEVEIVAINGEDHYSAAGELRYLQDNAGHLDEIALAVNLDGVGYREGHTAYSLYSVSPEMAVVVATAFSSHRGLAQGDPWVQGDHMVFVMNQRPAVALTSGAFTELWTEVAHTHRDTPDLVDGPRLVDCALALRDLLLALDTHLP